MMPVAPVPVVPVPTKRKLGFLIADIVGNAGDGRRSPVVTADDEDEERHRGKICYTPSPPPAHSQKPDLLCKAPSPSGEAIPHYHIHQGGTPLGNAAYLPPYEAAAITGRQGLVLPFPVTHARPQELYHPGYGPPPPPHPASPYANAAASLNSCPLRFPPSTSPVSLYFVGREATCQLTPWRLVRHPRFGPYGATGAQPASLFFHKFHKPKRIRTAFSPSQLLSLEHAFEKNQYVVGAERKDLARNLGLTETQVKVWFQNRRTKHKRQKQEEEEMHTRRTEQPSPDSSRSPGVCQRGELMETSRKHEADTSLVRSSAIQEGVIELEDKGVS